MEKDGNLQNLTQTVAVLLTIMMVLAVQDMEHKLMEWVPKNI